MNKISNSVSVCLYRCSTSSFEVLPYKFAYFTVQPDTRWRNCSWILIAEIEFRIDTIFNMRTW